MEKKIDWKSLGFSYMQTECFVKAEYKNGVWGPLSVCTEPYLTLHVAATCLHYGQACFEGQKAFHRQDGSIGVFRPEENAKRLIDTARRLVMKPPQVELFLEALTLLISRNSGFVPPYGTGASLYIRPLLIGSSPHIGVHPSEDYVFLMLATPMGPYYKNGFFPVKAYLQEKFDRAAPHGVGNVKAAGNYAAGMMGDLEGKELGYPICLYLDSAQHRYIDEFGTSNFLAITRDGAYVTPQSSSILPSVTNKSIQQIATDFGMNVERRKIAVTELGDFAEVGACGTAVVITPVYSIQHGAKLYTFGKEHEAGPILTKLYTEIQKIQYGEMPDRHQWMYVVKPK
ncbi:MAG TPA: branched-chain amino acid aminotransferase [Chitinivibrionales bacterium]